MLRPLSAHLEDAVAAAAAIRRAAEDMRARQSISVNEFVRWVNGLQQQFERVRPLLSRDRVEVQEAAVKLYGAAAPADVFEVLNGARASGANVVAAAFGVYPATGPAHAADPAAGVYHERNLAGTDLAPLATPLDELIAALDPVAG